MKDIIYLTLMEFYAQSTDERGTFADVINSDLSESISNILERQGPTQGLTDVSHAIARSWHERPENLHARVVAIEICRRVGIDAP